MDSMLIKFPSSNVNLVILGSFISIILLFHINFIYLLQSQDL